MANRRMDFSLSITQALILLTGGAVTLFLAFGLGLMVGREMKDIPLLDKEVKSDVVKMKIESAPMPQPSAKTTAHNEKDAVMSNATSKPVMTFYETLAKPGKNGKGAEPSEAKSEAKTDRKTYAVQAGALKDKSLADAMVSKLKKNGYSAYIVSSESGGKGTWYRVRLGIFSSREEARKEAVRIEKNEGIATTVVER